MVLYLSLSLARDKIQCSRATKCLRNLPTFPPWLSLFRHDLLFPDDEDVCGEGGSVNPCMLVLAGDEDLLTLGPCSPHPLPSDFTPKKVPDFQAQAPAVNHTGIGFCYLFRLHILHQKRGAIEGGWGQVGSSHFNENLRTVLHLRILTAMNSFLPAAQRFGQSG